jgi:CheY-like chemotaxis protein
VRLRLARRSSTAYFRIEGQVKDRRSPVAEELLSVVSHELRSPLNAIRLWVRQLRRGMLDEAQTAHALEVIDRSLDVQVHLLNDLADVSRIAAGKLEIENGLVELRSVVGEVVELHAASARDKGIELDSRLDAGPIGIQGDRARLKQVISVLLSNAIRFTPAGGSIALETRSLDGRAEVVVRDTGGGVTTDRLPQVFDALHLGGTTATREQGAAGLDLAIARHLVELHGGLIRAESGPSGQGATFVVVLPVRAERQEPLAPAESLGRRTHFPRLLGIRALVVDDDPDSRESAAEALVGCGAKVVAAASAGEAVRELGEASFDVVITDIRMPEADGYALLAKIRARDRQEKSYTPVLALTAFGSGETAGAMPAGFDLYLVKPISLEELAEATWLSSQGRWGDFARSRVG